MAKERIEKLEVHPLIAKQEKSGESTVEFRGFVGTGDNDVLRLYTDLGMFSYVDIPKDAVVYVEKDLDGITGKVRAFVSPDKKVTEVYKHTVSAHASLLSATGATFNLISPEQLELLRKGAKAAWHWCYAGCEGLFADAVPRILQMEAEAFRSGDASKIAAAQRARAEAISALHTCITQCQDRYPLSRIYLGSVEEIVSRISEKYFGKA